jgi:tetratricopeptide (TPR) repeat protein
MGDVYMVQGDFFSARDLFERARDIYRRNFTLDGDHQDIAKCWHLIEQAQVTLENNTEASEAFEKALRM